jgi:hypothetical protein
MRLTSEAVDDDQSSVNGFLLTILVVFFLRMDLMTYFDAPENEFCTL